jgi:exo-beta-1,3-glucanase (GH17 family)
MRLPVGLFAVCAAVIVAAWYWLGAPVQMPASPLGAGEKLYCLSYAPFREGQNPLGPGTKIEPRQIDDDLSRLSRLTNCVRTYSVEHGLDRIPEIARRHGMKVLHGLWLSGLADKNREQVETTIALAKQFPDVIQAVFVGNEVLLRGEMSSTDLARTIRYVKSQIPMPVSYADVWEFWLRHRDVTEAVDFVTIHILPYWEDFPIRARDAAAHVDSIRKRVVAAFPDKQVLLGEAGWPSAGRMREGALPSPVNQARVLHEVLAAAKNGNYQVNLIEAFDQPWKRQLEGTVGSHWGLFDAYRREPKFVWGGTVSDHPHWPWQAAGGVIFAALIFAAGWLAAGKTVRPPDVWFGIAINAAGAGVLIGWTIANVALESFGWGGWIRSLSLAATAVATPLVGAAALAKGVPLPSFAGILADWRRRGWLQFVLGALLILLAVLAIVVALGLVFDPRYRDFPFAPLTAAVLPLLVLALLVPAPAGRRGAAEIAAAALLGLSAIYILFNESFANWQALWCCGALVGLVVILLRVRGAPG